MTVYLDVILYRKLVHELYNPFCNRLYYETKMKQLRIIISSLIGGIYAIISYINIIPIYSTLIAKIILSISMIYIAYFPKNIKLCFKELVLFLCCFICFWRLCICTFVYIIKPQNILIKMVYI